MEIINPLAHDVDKLMVKSESRWTALTTALNHSVATLMIHERIFCGADDDYPGGSGSF